MPVPLAGAIKIIAALFVGTGVAATGAYVVKDEKGRPLIQSWFAGDEAEPAQTEPAQAGQGEEPQKLAALPEDEPAEEQVPAGPALPTFDILRVEPDGSVVIAGNAPAFSMVEITAAGEVLGTGEAGSNGDFAIVFDEPLAPGDHELYIRATLRDSGEVLVSAEAGIISIPQAGGEALAMVSSQGAPTRVLQQPEASTPEQISQPAPEPVAEAPAAEQPVAEPAVEPVETASLRIQAVDVEEGRVFVAGTGEPGRRVAIYIDNAFRGSTTIGSQGAFLFDLSGGLQPGTRNFRVDMLDTAGEVAGRIQVAVEHAAEDVAVAEAAPAAEPAPEPASQPASEPAGEAAPTQPVQTAQAGDPAVRPVLRTGSSVIIRRGDSLWKVSRRLLGEGSRYTVIFSANASQIANPDLIFPGQVFDIPEGDGGNT